MNLGQVFTQILWTNRSPGPGVVPWCGSRDVDPLEAPMNTTRHMLLTAALAGSLALTACTDEASDPPSPSSSGPVEESSPTDETSPSGSPSSEPTDTGPSDDQSPSASPSDAGTSPSPSSPVPSGSGSATPSPSDGGSPSPSDGGSSPSEDAAGLPPMPAAAKENSEEGAEAFARWYVQTLAHLFRFPEKGVIEPYSEDSCQQCGTYEEAFAELVAAQQHQVGSTMNILGTYVGVADKPSTIEVVVAIAQGSNRTVDANGVTVRESDGVDGLGLRLNLHYAGGWRIDEIPTDPTAGDWVRRD